MNTLNDQEFAARKIRADIHQRRNNTQGEVSVYATPHAPIDAMTVDVTEHSVGDRDLVEAARKRIREIRNG